MVHVLSSAVCYNKKADPPGAQTVRLAAATAAGEGMLDG
jgi:hypothetical protein